MSRPVTPAHKRFFAKVEQTDGCWMWRAARGGTGGPVYGLFRDGRMVYAHRWAYEYAIGPIPEGYQIDHLCRVPLCVNPAHLEAVTPSENTIRTLPYRKPRRVAAA